jgi:hypothetical protein
VSELPHWVEETETAPAEVAPADSPFRAPGKTDERVTMALTQSRWKPGGPAGGGIVALIGAGYVAMLLSGLGPIGLIAGAIGGGYLGLRLMLQPRLEVRATPEGIEIVSGRRVRHRVARRQLRELAITGGGVSYWLEAVDREGLRKPLVVSSSRDELIAIADKVAAHLGLRRSAE